MCACMQVCIHMHVCMCVFVCMCILSCIHVIVFGCVSIIDVCVYVCPRSHDNKNSQPGVLQSQEFKWSSHIVSCILVIVVVCGAYSCLHVM